ncbi:hypothetical protein BBP40_011557 [Aspergillus hancockii]|nr:hypothetical protein BBP40_011557 [Aspergillus hancockii]
MGPQSKRRKTSKVEEITFDDSARHEWLTGFRKRKQQRIKHAQQVAEDKAREIKREERKRIREEREAEFKRAIEEHQKQLKRLREEDGSDSGSESEDDDNAEWEGCEEPPAVDYEAEYIDEDKYTTVTVEEMDASREGLLRSQDHDSDEEHEDEETKPSSEADSKAKQVEKTKKKASDNKPKKKKKKFRYESKEERQVSRRKERLSNHRKAQARRER